MKRNRNDTADVVSEGDVNVAADTEIRAPRIADDVVRHAASEIVAHNLHLLCKFMDAVFFPNPDECLIFFDGYFSLIISHYFSR